MNHPVVQCCYGMLRSDVPQGEFSRLKKLKDEKYMIENKLAREQAKLYSAIGTLKSMLSS